MDWTQRFLDFLVSHSKHLDALARLVVLVGVPAGLLQYFLKTRKERRDREYGTYNALDEKYLEFQRLCLDHHRLDVFDVPDKAPVKLSQEEEKQELIAFTLLISIFERAFIMYRDKSKRIREQQWTGWNDYVISYCRRKNFRDAWRICGDMFDTDFRTFMRDAFRAGAEEKVEEGAPNPPLERTGEAAAAQRQPR